MYSYYLTIILGCSITLLAGNHAYTQDNVEGTRANNIKTPMLFPTGNPMGLPIIKLNSTDQLELHFDDLDAGFKNYFYTLQLCNADWGVAMLSYFDYIKGFSNNRINTYRISSIAQQKYTHYQAMLPERNCMPIRSGNYILRVYVNGDTSKTAFTKKLMVYDDKTTVGAQLVQPINSALYTTHQRIVVRLNTQSLTVPNPIQQVKMVVMQNNRWDVAQYNTPPTFIRSKELEYNMDNILYFAAGREWRWADLRSFRFWSDRVASGIQAKGSNTILMKPDAPRNTQRYFYYRDINGMYLVENTDNVNPYWQGDYATVKFVYQPTNKQPLEHTNVYLVGQCTNYVINESTKMTFNATNGCYENEQFLKQGYYNYTYVTIDNLKKDNTTSLALTEGNYFDTENTYQILVYYRALGARADELIGYSNINSLNGRTAFGLGF